MNSAGPNPWASRPVRVLAVLAAMCLVLAFALATMMPPRAPLAELVMRRNPAGLVNIERFMAENLPGWAWTMLVEPVLARPGWLVPLGGAMVLGGTAASLALHRRAREPQRRRG